MAKPHAGGEFVRAPYGDFPGRVEHNAAASIKNVVVFDGAPQASSTVARAGEASPHCPDRDMRREADPAEPDGDLFAIGSNDGGLAPWKGGRKEAVLKFPANFVGKLAADIQNGGSIIITRRWKIARIDDAGCWMWRKQVAWNSKRLSRASASPAEPAKNRFTLRSENSLPAVEAQLHREWLTSCGALEHRNLHRIIEIISKNVTRAVTKR